ncbi:MAG: HAD family hydrolase [Lentisphaeria bacterium]|nr:HAD family hydrolase [Lentisphaeria bacterium]
MKKAFFLDRDGVVVEQVHYLCDPEQTVLEKGVAQAISKMHSLGYLVVVVTNQSGVARGKFTMKEVEAVHQKISELLARDGEKIDAFYICPHHPDFDGACDCRKPAPGLLLKAAKDLDIDIASSIMVGDKLSDVRCGENAGCLHSLLISTGYGSGEREKPGAEKYPFINDLEEAVDKFI